MIRLMYFSTATRHMTGSDVNELIPALAISNRKRGVTGMLTFNGRNFCQVLEGEEQQIIALLEVIRADERHAGFKVLGKMPIDASHYDEWPLTRVKELNFPEAMGAMDS